MDCVHAVRLSRVNPSAHTVFGSSFLGNPASFGQAIGHAIEVKLPARGEEPPVPLADNKKRKDLLEELQTTWPGTRLREHNIPGPRCMDQLWKHRKPDKEQALPVDGNLRQGRKRPKEEAGSQSTLGDSMAGQNAGPGQPSAGQHSKLPLSDPTTVGNHKNLPLPYLVDETRRPCGI